MTVTGKRIEKFMKLGEPRVDMFLRWWGRESFFDDGVQEVLLRFHPENQKHFPDDLLGFPIHAWSTVDSVRMAPCEKTWSDLLPIMQRFPLWTAELLHAMMRYHARQTKQPDTLRQLIDWRNERYLGETPRVKYTHEQVVEHNTLIKRRPDVEAMAERLRAKEKREGRKPLTPIRTLKARLVKWLKESSPPLPIDETLPPPKKWMEGTKRSLSPEAYRKAAHIENKRRDAIMQKWAVCWVAYLHI